MKEQNLISGKNKTIDGFSQLSKIDKLKWIAKNFFTDPEKVYHELSEYWHKNSKKQEIFEGFSENTISNFYLPYSVAPNFIINGKTYCIPMVTEESSVVAAASSAAKYWSQRGGFHTKVINTTKIGHISFEFKEHISILEACFNDLKSKMEDDVKELTINMRKRGGGIQNIHLKSIPSLENIYQIFVEFNTCESMGANFINSVLETMAQTMNDYFEEREISCEVLMSILSNYTPECIVEAKVACPVSELGYQNEEKMDPLAFARRFEIAVNLANNDVYRAVTHNKGIMNGIDAVIIATANDFRAIEAGAHAYAAREGQYRSLSKCSIKNDVFQFSLTIPLAIGTVGGLTSLHPMAKRSLELLGSPDAEELMGVIAAVGLAQNFAAVKSLVTSGIQKGHMKMHLKNILLQNHIPQQYHDRICDHFKDKTISISAVRNYYDSLQE
jgi:hydroxymethylglutaryl-CoA reductase